MLWLTVLALQSPAPTAAVSRSLCSCAQPSFVGHHTAFRKSFHTAHVLRQRRQRTRCQTAGTSQAAEALKRGRDRFEAGDRMGALRQFEDVLRKDPSVEERQKALYNATCIHAGFGDVELAQITLRDGVTCGLDLEAAIKDPDSLKLNAPPQIVIQLKKFADTVKRVRAAVSPTVAGKVPVPGKPEGVRSRLLTEDMGTVLRTEITGMDASALGIVKRVGLLLLIALVGGTAIFYIGLYLAFGDLGKR